MLEPRDRREESLGIMARSKYSGKRRQRKGEGARGNEVNHLRASIEEEKKKKAERPREDRSKFVWRKTDALLRMALHRDGQRSRDRNAGRVG